MEINILVGIDPGISAGGIAIYKPGSPLVTVKMPEEPLDKIGRASCRERV